MTDTVNHPTHYCSHESGIECIQITEHMNFCLGNAVKYIWRAGLKSDKPIEDLKKAAWYIKREIARIESYEHSTVKEPEALPSIEGWIPCKGKREERSSPSHVCSESDNGVSKDGTHPTRSERSFKS